MYDKHTCEVTCDGCGGRITDVYYVGEDNTDYHPGCFIMMKNTPKPEPKSFTAPVSWK